MNIREAARKAGGDELVARLDAANAVKYKLVKQIDDLIGEAIDGEAIDGGEADRDATIAAVCEAMSGLFAKSVVFMHECDPKQHGKTELIVMAIRSLSNNITAMFDEIEVKKSGIGDLIMAAAKKGASE